MEDPVADAILNQYFRRLEQALSGLPAERRSQIVEDLREHVEDCLQSEPDHSDATVLAILDRVGDPDEIAREALADDTLATTTGDARKTGGPAARVTLDEVRRRWRLTASGLVILVAAAVVAIVLGAGGSASAPKRDPGPTVRGRLISAHSNPRDQSGSAAWLPASDVSGDHGSPGASDCSPQTTSGSESASTLEAGATKVASGSVDGHDWSAWSKNGQSGANGLETGGVVVDGVAHGLCPGFPNPGEMELLEPSGGGDGIAYGVVGYAGTAKVAIYQDTFGNFATTKLIATTDAQKVNGVGFFITSLSESACDVPGAELNTASSDNSTEHNLAFATSDCQKGQLVPISDSQGIWGLPTSGFPDKFHTAGGGGGAGGGGEGTAPTLNKNGWLPAGDVSGGGGVDDSACGPQTLSGSEPMSALQANSTQVASGTTAGFSWSVWSKNGQSGATGLENGGVVVNGVAYGMCPGFPNPSETELIEPSSGGDGLAYGVVGYPGTSKVAIYQGTVETFATGQLLASTTAQKVNGVGFYITPLSMSGCDVASLEINVASSSYASEHNLGFSDKDCSNGQLVPISWSQGIWQLSPTAFPNKFETANGGGGAGTITPPTSKGGWLPASDVSGDHGSPGASDCSPQTTSGSESASALEAGATKVASGSVDGHDWSAWSKNGQSGANGLETGGVVVDGVAHGLCPGFPNPGEMELLEPSGGGDGIAYGVVGYPGTARVAIYKDTFGNFATTKLVGTTTAQKVNGVGFFFTKLSESACDIPGIEMNTASSSSGTEHSLAFATSDCKDGQLVPISDSQGDWGLPTSGYPDNFQTGGSAQPGSGAVSRQSILSMRSGPSFSNCSHRTNEAQSGTTESSVPGASQVASGSLDGQSWSLWSEHGEHGSAAIEDAGVILDGRSYTICPGAPNPAEFELVDPSSGADAVVIGVSGYDGPAAVKVFAGTSGTFDAGALLYSGHTVSADGTGFFIGQLAKPACAYHSLLLKVQARGANSEHSLDFGDCKTGKLSQVEGGQGSWSTQPTKTA